MEEEQLEVSNSIEENLEMVNYIMLHRIYDLLTLVADHFDTDKTKKMIEYHESGYLLGPSPSYMPDKENL